MRFSLDRFLVVLIGFVLLIPPGAVADEISTNVDMFSGRLRSTLAIETLPGRRKIQPGLVVTYTSPQRNNWLGRGWDLSLGSIERDTTLGMDTLRYAFHTSESSDELVPVAPNEYSVRIEAAFRRFSLRTAGGQSMWEVTATDGTRYFYGRTENSRVSSPVSGEIFEWALDRVQDAYGNYMEVTYARFGAEIYPAEIGYAGNGDMPPTNVIRFITEARADVSPDYRWYFDTAARRRLSQIQILANGVLIRTYEFSYDVGIEYSRLRSVVESMPSGRHRTLASIRYDSANGTANGWVVNAGWTDAPDQPAGTRCTSGDFNGDARTDIACWTGGSAWDVALSTASGWSKRVWTGGAQPRYTVQNECTAFDANGDGRTDVLCNRYPYIHPEDGGSSAWFVSLSTGDGWLTSEFGSGPTPAGPLHRLCMVGSFGAYGRSGISCYQGNGSWTTMMLTAEGWETSRIDGLAPGVPIANQCLAGDFNGDQLTDIACRAGGATWALALSTGSAFTIATWPNGPLPRYTVGNECMPADVNGDGLTDLLCNDYSGGIWPNKGGSSLWHVSLSTGVGWRNSDWSNGATPEGPVTRRCLMGDHDGDGKSDLVCYADAATWTIARSTGDGWSTKSEKGPAPGVPISVQCIPGDWDGDARLDIACYRGGGTNWHVAATGERFVGVVASVTNRLGGITSVEYGSSCRFQNTRLPFPIPVITRLTIDAGNAAQSIAELRYEGGYYSYRDRKMRGFGHVTRRRSGTVGAPFIEQTWFHQGDDVDPMNTALIGDGRLTGRPYRETTQMEGAGPAQEVIIYYVADDSEPFFTPVRRKETTTFAETGSRTTAKEYEYDYTGNITQITDLGDVDDSDDDTLTELVYRHDDRRWMHDRPLSLTIRAGKQPRRVLKRISYTYGGQPPCAAALLNDVDSDATITSVGPGHVTQRRGFDRFGNTVCTLDAGGGLGTVEFDDSGTFPMLETDPAGRQTRSTYYGVGGVPTIEGAFGRLRTQRRHDGSSQTYEYDWRGDLSYESTATGYWRRHEFVSEGAPGLQFRHVLSSAGEDRREYLDGLGRVVSRQLVSFGHNVINQTYTFDYSGNRVTETEPAFVGEMVRARVLDYDVLGRKATVKYADGTSERWCYGPKSVVYIARDGSASKEEINAHGQTTRTVRFPAASSCRVPEDGVGQTVSYERDLLGRVTRLTLPNGASTEFRYDERDLVVSVNHPDSGHWVYQYNDAGNAILITDGRGRSTYQTFDAVGRVVQRRYRTRERGDGVNQQFTYTRDDGEQPSLLESARTGEVVSTYTYDKGGRTTEVLTRIGRHSSRLRASYTDEGRIATRTYGDGFSVGYQYEAGLLSRVMAGSRPLLTVLDYDATRRPVRYRYGNGTVTRASYSGQPGVSCGPQDDVLCAFQVIREDGEPLLDMRMRYNEQSRMIEVSDNENVRKIAYDAFGRVASSSDSVIADAFEHDGAANILNHGRVGRFTYVPSPPVNGERSAGENEVLYDANGNVLSALGLRLSFGDDNLPSWARRSGGGRRPAGTGDVVRRRTVANAQFIYDALGQLAATRVNGHLTMHAGRFELCGRRCGQLIFADQRVIAVRHSDDGELQFVHSDYLGSIRAMSDAVGKTICRADHTIFGEPTYRFEDRCEFDVFARLFYDPNLGLYRSQTRLYDPVTGRFLQPDATDLLPNMAHETSGYAYADGRPVVNVDPTGMQAEYYLPNSDFWRDERSVFSHPGPQYGVLSGGQPDHVGYLGFHGTFEMFPLFTPDGESLDANIERAKSVERALMRKNPIVGLFLTGAIFAVAELTVWNYRARAGRIYEDFGNANYGAVGSALGFPAEVLLRAAGAVQLITYLLTPPSYKNWNPSMGYPWGAPPFGDDSWDQHRIRQGIDHARHIDGARP